MANFLQQIKLDGELYDLHDSEFIIDNRTAAGAALTGVSKAPALFDGMQISYWLDYAAGSNATLNLTLADGTKTGAIPVYYSGTSRLTTHYAAGNVLHMTYRENAVIAGTARGAGWWCDANYYSDSNYDIVGTSIPIKTRLNAYCLCAMVGTSGTIAKQTNTAGAGTYWEINAFTQSSGTGTSKKLVPNQGYYPGKIFYYTGSSAITDADSVSGTISGGTSNVDLRYTVNGSTSANIGVTGAPFFFVGSLGSDGLFYPNGHDSQATKEWWQCGFPTDLTSTYVYWYVGMMSSKYQCRLSDTNWMLKSDGTKWIVFDGAMSSGVSWNDITGKPTEFTPASHTHGYISNDGAITDAMATTPASGDKIVVTDSSDSNKVKGAITIGSDDGKFLKHDGTWEEPNHVIQVLYADSEYTVETPVATLTEWAADVLYGNATVAIRVHDSVNDTVDYYQSTEIITYGSNSFLIGNHQMALDLDDNGVGSIETFIIAPGGTGVQCDKFSGKYPFAPTENSSGRYVLEYIHGDVGSNYNWQAIEIPVEAPSTDGDYSLNVSNGTTSWTTASGGPNTPDAPASDGNYVLNVDSGSSSWQEAPEGALIVEFNTAQGMYVVAGTSFTELSAALTSGRTVYIKFNISGAVTTGLIEILSSRYVPSSESSASYDMYACSVIIPAGTPNLFSGDPLKHETQATVPIGDAGDGEHVATATLMIAYSMAGTFSVYGGNNTVVVNKSDVELANGLLNISTSNDLYAIQAPYPNGTTRYDFIAYQSD